MMLGGLGVSFWGQWSPRCGSAAILETFSGVQGWS